MKCPLCQNTNGSQVTDSRVTYEGNSIRRRRVCKKCKKRFSTYETSTPPIQARCDLKYKATKVRHRLIELEQAIKSMHKTLDTMREPT